MTGGAVNWTPYVLAAFGLVVSVLGALIGRSLKQIDANEKAMWRRVDEHTKELARLDKELAVTRAIIERAERAEE